MFRHVRGGRLHFPDKLFLARKIMSSFSWLKILYHQVRQLSFLQLLYAHAQKPYFYLALENVLGNKRKSLNIENQ